MEVLVDTMINSVSFTAEHRGTVWERALNLLLD